MTTLVFAFLAMIATAFAAYFTGQQWITTADQERRQLRAYISIVGGTVDRFDVNKSPEYGLSIKNFGGTPAYRVGIRGGSEAVPFNSKRLYAIIDYRSVPKANSDTIYPQQEYPMRIPSSSTDPVVTDHTHQAVETGSLVVVNFGTLYYEDIFGSAWKSDFCFFYRWDDILRHNWTKGFCTKFR